MSDRTYSLGDRITSSAGSQHQPKTLSGCLLYLHTSLDDEILK